MSAKQTQRPTCPLCGRNAVEGKRGYKCGLCNIDVDVDVGGDDER